jgi:hypothetical protein
MMARRPRDSGADNGSPVDPIWWEASDPGAEAYRVADALDKQQQSRREIHARYARLYANTYLSSIYDFGTAKIESGEILGPHGARLSMNVCQSCVDTAAAKISKNKPRVLVLTSGGNYKLRRKAKLLTKFCDGLFALTGIYEEAQRCFVDAAVFGTGFLKIFADKENATLRCERILPDEIIISDIESIYGRPRSLYQRKYIHRSELLALYGDDEGDAQAIREAVGSVPGAQGRSGASASRSDMIPVIEAWHLPSEGGDDGLRTIAISGRTLVKEKWDKPWFPFAIFRWNPKLLGLFGQGLIEQLIGIQLEINRLLRVIQQAQHLMAVPRYLVEGNSQVVIQHLNNEIGAIVRYQGAEPKIQLGQAVPPELYTWLDRLKTSAFELTGISQMSAAAQKPAGLNSGEAIRTYHEVESERFVVVGQAWERFFLDASRVMVELSRDMYKDGGKEVKVKAPGTKLIEQISWKDVDMTEDAYDMRSWPVSALPTTPAGRLQKVQELYEAGFLDREQAMSLLDFPDLERVVSLQVAAFDDIAKTLDSIVDDGKYNPPDEYIDLTLARKLTHSMYLRARTEDVPGKRLEMLRRYLDEVDFLLSAQQPAPAAPDPMAAPQAMPAPAAMPTPQMPDAIVGNQALPSELPVVQ